MTRKALSRLLMTAAPCLASSGNQMGAARLNFSAEAAYRYGVN
jgi:hypothetical protein